MPSCFLHTKRLQRDDVEQHLLNCGQTRNKLRQIAFHCYVSLPCYLHVLQELFCKKTLDLYCFHFASIWFIYFLHFPECLLTISDNMHGLVLFSWVSWVHVDCDNRKTEKTMTKRENSLQTKALLLSLVLKTRAATIS